jgi:hypothetical protein
MTRSPGSTRLARTEPADSAVPARTGSFHTALRAAIEARGLTLERLQDRLAQHGIQVSVTSLSYWQHGRSQPERPDSIRAVTVLEKVLGTPAGALVALLGPPRPRGPRSLRGTPAERPEDVMGIGAPLSRLFDELPGSRDYALDLISQQETVTIDGRGHLAHISSRGLAEARHDGVDRYITVYQGDEGCDVRRFEIAAVRDCAVGRVLRDVDAGVVVAEVLFGGQLSYGETHLFEFEVSDGTAPTLSHSHGFRCRVDQFVLQARFDPAAVPPKIEGFVQSRLDDSPRSTGPLHPNAHSAVHVSSAQVSPGGIGIGWQWS